MSLEGSEWFFCIVYTSLTGSLAYGLWKVAEKIFKAKKRYDWIIVSSKLVILFWTIPFVFLMALGASHGADGGWNDDFGVSRILLVVLRWLFFIWAVGFCWQMFRYLRARMQLKRLHKCSLDASDEASDILEELRNAYGIKREVAVHGNLSCKIPQVSGVFRPVILLPAAPQEEESLRVVIGHELTHIRNGDLAWKCLLSWLLRVYWFNPVFCFMFRDIMDWNEFSCDRDMCGRKGAPADFSEYFDVILRMSRKDGGSGGGNRLPMSLYENGTSIERRIRMMKGYRYEREWKRGTVLCLSVLFAAVASLTSYAAGKGFLAGYTAVKEATMVVYEEEIQEPEELEEVRIPAGTESGVIEIEMSEEEARAKTAWSIPVNTSKRTPGFSCSVGDEIDVTALVRPGDKLTRVGIIEPDGGRRAVSSTRKIVHTFKVEKNGTHKVYVENQSDVAIEVEVSYHIY